MKKQKLGLKKITLRDLDQQSLGTVAGGTQTPDYTNCHNCYTYLPTCFGRITCVGYDTCCNNTCYC